MYDKCGNARERVSAVSLNGPLHFNEASTWEKISMQDIASWPRSVIAWLDNQGKGAWICVMVLGFIFFWPIGLGILFFLLWSNRMGKKKSPLGKMSAKLGLKSTKNTAFESYKHETISRLKQEQKEFESFLDRLRHSKDKAEFDQFMAERERDTNSAA